MSTTVWTKKTKIISGIVAVAAAAIEAHARNGFNWHVLAAAWCGFCVGFAISQMEVVK